MLWFSSLQWSISSTNSAASIWRISIRRSWGLEFGEVGLWFCDLKQPRTAIAYCSFVFFPINFSPKWSACLLTMNVGIFRRCPAGKFDPKGECLGKILYEAEVWLNTNCMLEVALWIISIQNWDLECLGKAILEIIFLISKIYVRKLSNSQLDSMTALVLQTISTSHFLGTNN